MYSMKPSKQNRSMCCLVLLSTVITGCASLTPEQCQVADWKSLGEKDGFQGRDEQLANHLKSCAPIGVTPNASLYRQGYQAGLAVYCQPQNILNQALQGSGRIEVCPIKQQQLLQPYYRAGADLYSSKSNLNQLNREQEQFEKELAEHKTSDQRRKELRQKLRELDTSLSRARDDLRDSQRRFARFNINR
jgi:hypothetical protein